MGFLPTSKTVKKTNNPKNLIMFGLPKSGKTTALSQLPGCLIIDLENGSDYVENAFVTKAANYKDLYKLARALSPVWNGEKNDKYEPHEFKFVAIDTITSLEEMSLDLAAKRYSESPVGKNWMGTGQDILKLPMGAGY
ncbi:MAG: AAA family ATPase [Bacillota bacterium]|nr:AAA family ATPase [Bacillota bacterium]